MKLLCLIGKHQRAGRSVRRMQDGWIGKCAHCGVAIQRAVDGIWTRASEAQVAAAEQYRTKRTE